MEIYERKNESDLHSRLKSIKNFNLEFKTRSGRKKQQRAVLIATQSHEAMDNNFTRKREKVMKKVMPFVFTLAVLVMPCAVFAQYGETTVKTTTTTTENAGTISEFSPDTIVIQSETTSSPTRYSYTKSTTYVDETGAPVSIETVKSGLPVTVYYTLEGDRMVANKVVVRKTTTKTIEKPAVQQRIETETKTIETK